MITLAYTIKDELGLHARPAGNLVKLFKRFESTVTLTKGDRFADARGIMALLGLGVRCGDEVQFEISGPDEQQVQQVLQEFLHDLL